MKCFYHGADLDGYYSSAIIKSRVSSCKMVPINHGDKFPWDSLIPGEIVFVVGFCLQPFSDMIALDDKVDLIWIDHHQASIDEKDRSKYDFTGTWILDPSKAACELVWEYIYPEEEVPFTVKYYSLIKDLDPKNWEDNKRQWNILFDENPPILTKELLKFNEKYKRDYVRAYSFTTTLADNQNTYNAIAVNLGHTNSKVFDSVWDETKYDIMITFCRRNDKKWDVSLYSTHDNINCGKIANYFGGGGHKGVAGFQCFELPFKY
jgi:uncharacterized protein